MACCRACASGSHSGFLSLVIRFDHCARAVGAEAIAVDVLHHQQRLAIDTIGEVHHPGSIDYLLVKLDDSDVAAQQAAVNAVSALVAMFPEMKAAVLAR